MRILDDGLDEVASRTYQGLPLRMATTVGVAALVSLMLPWRLCLIWLMVQSLSEGLAGFVSRPQHHGHNAGPRMRAAFLGTMLFGCSMWMYLGVVLWASGTTAGALSALILWLSVVFFGHSNAYQSTTGFVVGGAVPGMAMVAILVMGPNPLHLPLFPIVGLLVLALGFVCDGVVRSLAARRRFEETQRNLTASEAQYRMLADNITDVIWLNDVDGNRLYVSPSVKRALGYSPEEVLDQSLNLVHPDDREWVQTEITHAIESGTECTLQHRLIHRQGHAVWTESNIGPVPAKNPGEQPMIISVTRNIEAHKALETELVEARQRAEVATAAKSDFLANMTHELRTPLNAIIGFSGVLKGSPRLAYEDARHAGLIHAASATLLELVSSVLDFSKLEAGGVELETLPFDPVEPARAVASLMAEQASAKGLDLAVRVGGETSPLVGDPARIRQVLLNFLSNALKFTVRGAVTIDVRQTEAGPGLACLKFEVKDTGIGLTQSQSEHIFDRFTQADASVSREFGGTGLGLAICKRTIELMGGTIGCDSIPGQGSTFWFELVLPRAAALSAEVEESALKAPDAPMRLLLVEDVAVNRELVSTLLAPFDITIETAENGALAVEAMRHGHFDLVLMDVQMPVMDGLAATRAIRALPELHSKTTPIIAMTANVMPYQIQTCLDAGMDGHIGKPISPAALLAALSRWSAGRDEESARASA